ncbi:MAG: efflux RND transporter permease subunit [Planctomycetes bacterium]|nr:efflux RND transporter permease subunit [Planctomycetota bacterium]
MLNWIVSTSMRLRTLVIVAAALLVAFGVRELGDVPLDVFPEFAPPRIEVQTEAPGLSAAEVELLVSAPLEAALQGTPWLTAVRSKSVMGLSSVVLLLEPGADLMRARQFAQERLALAGGLPEVAHRPVILAPLSATSRALKIGLSSTELSQLELSALARWKIRPALMGVRGVANVALWGQRDRELQVLVDPERLQRHGVTLDEVVAATRAAASALTGGFVDTPNQRLAVRHVTELARPEDLARAVLLLRGGTPLLIGDVADVVEGFAPPIGDAVIDDGPGILLIVEKEPWGNTFDVTRGIDEALRVLAPALTGVHVDASIFRPATFIETALQNLAHALWIGCGLVVVVLVLFLFDWRAAVISVAAIPLSLIVAALVLARSGQTMNTMVLAGLVIALGEVVDDAIIDVENISRRLRANRTSLTARSAFRVVLEASLEVRSAVVFGSLIVVLVLMPVFFLEGLAGAFFRPLASAYVLAILASLAVALTVTPAMSLWLLPESSARAHDAPLVRLLKAGYARVLPWILARPRASLALLLGSLAATVAAIPALGEEFLPAFRERDFLMHWVEKPGTSIEAMQRITERASRELRSIPGVRSFGAHIGRAEAADEVVGPNFTELWISVDPAADYDATLTRIRAVVDGYPGLYRDVLTYLQERVKEVLTGASATLVVRIFGPELEGLGERAREVAGTLAGIEGVVDLKVEPQALVPQIEVRFSSEQAALHGLSAAAVRTAVTTLVKGAKAGEIVAIDPRAGRVVLDVAVRGVPAARADLAALGALLIDTPRGIKVPLSEVCALALVPAQSEIKREDGARRIDVTCNVRGRDLAAVAGDVAQRLAEVRLGPGYHATLLGEYAAREEARARMLAFAGLALLGIFLLLQVEFTSVRLALLVLLALPFALIGGVAGAFLGGGVLSLGSLIGFITVFGIAARNAIMMVSHFRHLELEEGERFGPELIVRGALERLSPVLMTALCAGLALVPLIASGSQPGQEIEHPMAIVIVGGLVTSTLLCLCFLPGLYLAFARPARASASPTSGAESEA